ncbi:MAG TPA: DNA-3-methyladenine glycosylase, partial [Egibacteraceae bacterium]|nr:DNA-3-methyladenine glycosylase [Egibacteraceae bacterium]
RGRTTSEPALLASGPARLCQALGVDRSLSGHDLLAGERLWLEPPPAGEEAADEQVASGPRVGVAYAGPDWADRPWRFWLIGHPAVSRR